MRQVAQYLRRVASPWMTSSTNRSGCLHRASLVYTSSCSSGCLGTIPGSEKTARVNSNIVRTCVAIMMPPAMYAALVPRPDSTNTSSSTEGVTMARYVPKLFKGLDPVDSSVHGIRMRFPRGLLCVLCSSDIARQNICVYRFFSYLAIVCTTLCASFLLSSLCSLFRLVLVFVLNMKRLLSRLSSTNGSRTSTLRLLRADTAQNSISSYSLFSFIYWRVTMMILLSIFSDSSEETLHVRLITLYIRKVMTT